MARGNQRDKAREKNLKEQAGKVCLLPQNFKVNPADDSHRKAKTLYVIIEKGPDGVLLNPDTSNPAQNLPEPRMTRLRLCVRSRLLVCQ